MNRIVLTFFIGFALATVFVVTWLLVATIGRL